MLTHACVLTCVHTSLSRAAGDSSSRFAIGRAGALSPFKAAAQRGGGHMGTPQPCPNKATLSTPPTSKANAWQSPGRTWQVFKNIN